MFVNNNVNFSARPSFGQIKSVKYAGLYKDRPDLATDVFQTFSENKNAMDFCKKYDVDIVLFARKDIGSNVKSQFILFYDNPVKNKLSKLLGFNKDDKVDLSSWSGDYFGSLEGSAKELKAMLKSHVPGDPNSRGGILDSHLRDADEKMSEALAKKTEKIRAKEDAVKEKEMAQSLYETNKSTLDATIQSLVNKSK